MFGTPAAGLNGARPYWDESVHYVFDMAEILSLEADVELLHSMCLEAVDHVVTTERFRDFALPEWCWEQVAASWRRGDPHLYGRFDLRYDGSGPAKLMEYNADTPTTLLEASICQWYWLKDVHPDDDQWNSLHEKLVERWGEIAAKLPRNEAHFCWSQADPTGEDHVTVAYLQESAAEAGLDTIGLAIEQLGWDSALDRFVDLEEAPIGDGEQALPVGVDPRRRLRQARHPQPAGDDVDRAAVEDAAVEQGAARGALGDVPRAPEPAARLAGRPRACSPSTSASRCSAARAPTSRSSRPGYETETGGVYGEEGYVYQLFDPLPEFDGYRPALGAWIVGDTSAGLGIRETTGLITDNGAAFVPHRIPD